ncbi:uncharacterized protein LOC136760086 isoform X2 [Amia ocellicauda]|uniref:uncharacterized protein LOC136760086 isoform X2 n=1 Tax=Amia ocellicauda TaxID=2972642 RepID=UPI0034640D58
MEAGEGEQITNGTSQQPGEREREREAQLRKTPTAPEKHTSHRKQQQTLGQCQEEIGFCGGNGRVRGARAESHVTPVCMAPQVRQKGLSVGQTNLCPPAVTLQQPSDSEEEEEHMPASLPGTSGMSSLAVPGTADLLPQRGVTGRTVRPKASAQPGGTEPMTQPIAASQAEGDEPTLDDPPAEATEAPGRAKLSMWKTFRRFCSRISDSPGCAS